MNDSLNNQFKNLLKEQKWKLLLYIVGGFVGGWLIAMYSPSGREERAKIAVMEAKVAIMKQHVAQLQAANAATQEQIAFTRAILFFRTYKGASAHGPDVAAILSKEGIFHSDDPWTNRSWLNYSAAPNSVRVLTFEDQNPPVSTCVAMVKLTSMDKFAVMNTMFWVEDKKGEVIATAEDPHFESACQRPDAVLAGTTFFQA